MGNKKPARIAPSILSADFGRLAAEIEAVDQAGADWIHVDVMDGHFVPNLTIGPLVVRAAREATKKPLDVHLMIEKPERYIEAFVEAGADHVGVHLEACPHLHSTVAQIRKLGARASVSLNPSTPPESLEFVLGDIDQVLVMSVNPGFGGQRFIPGVLAKIERIRRWIDERDLDVDLQVDGGITVDTIPLASKAGADCFVAGTAVYGPRQDGTRDYRAAIEALRSATTA